MSSCFGSFCKIKKGIGNIPFTFMKKQVIIIGAGPAGITAAFELLKKSDEYQVVILEESREIGGISRTVRYNGNRMDIGGHRFFSKDAEVNAWWDALMPRQGAPAYDDKVLDREVPARRPHLRVWSRFRMA